MLAAARRIAPKAAALSNEIEAGRRLPTELTRELAEAGLYRMVMPAALGGFELHPLTVIDVLETLARADAATGWCVMTGALTAMTAAWLPDEAAKHIFGRPEVMTSGVTAPMGRAEFVGGSYYLTGWWPSASGGAHCQWLAAGAVVTENGRPKMMRKGVAEMRLFFVPREEVILHETWRASGLCGTGVGNMEITNVRVPAERSLSLTTRPRVRGPLYDFPCLGLPSVGGPAVALGVARRALDELLVAAHQERRLLLGQRALARWSALQEAVVACESVLRGARAYLLEAAHAAHEAATRREVSLHHRAALRLSCTHATQSAVRIVRELVDATGEVGGAREDLLQRCLRDVQAVSEHAAFVRPTVEPPEDVLPGVPAAERTPFAMS
ncbi:putative hydrolase NrgC [Chondromyces apiculatus DSM 436]|uniref:Putative hydrolase NrgC n=1 Tax=Chondromyces apiculatus DSM 436 TaxID=1192034 RepID=A0A017T1K0_9BACT|nr:putative hydrolase NrgC [Chondromyces apiculatus DSM 436]